jgi:ferritin-like metal-binding protein YciE
MALATMHDLMIAELKDIYSAETQLVKALPKMARGSVTPTLRRSFDDHLDLTNEHVARLEKIFSILGVSPRGTKCKGMECLIEEGAEMLDEEGDETVRDAGIIAAAQRIEHYEISAYGSTLAIATLMGHTDIAELLEQTLQEEKAADELLSTIAENDVNSQAPSMDEEDEEDEADRPTRSATRKSAVARK